MNSNRNGDVSAIAFALAIALISAGKISAGVLNIYGTAAPTPGLTGYTTYTLSMQTDVAEVGALDFLGGQAVGGFGFFGPMHHVQPNEMGTVFRDYNEMLGVFGQDSRQDSQFLFSSTDILSIRPSESENSLHAAFAGFDSFGTDFNFAQIVVPDGQEVTFRGQLAYRTPNMDLPAQDFAGVVGAGLLFESEVVWPLPEIVVEPEPTPPPVPAQPPEVPPLPPEPIENDPLPELEIPPTEADPVEPPPLDPDEPVNENNPIMIFPHFPRIEIDGIVTIGDPIPFPRLTDPIFTREGVIIDDSPISQFLAFDGDGFGTFGAESFPRTSGFMAFDGTSFGFGEKSQQRVPEPTALIQSLVIAALIIFRMRAR